MEIDGEETDVREYLEAQSRQLLVWHSMFKNGISLENDKNASKAEKEPQATTYTSPHP